MESPIVVIAVQDVADESVAAAGVGGVAVHDAAGVDAMIPSAIPLAYLFRSCAGTAAEPPPPEGGPNSLYTHGIFVERREMIGMFPDQSGARPPKLLSRTVTVWLSDAFRVDTNLLEYSWDFAATAALSKDTRFVAPLASGPSR